MSTSLTGMNIASSYQETIRDEGDLVLAVVAPCLRCGLHLADFEWRFLAKHILPSKREKSRKKLSKTCGNHDNEEGDDKVKIIYSDHAISRL